MEQQFFTSTLTEKKEIRKIFYVRNLFPITSDKKKVKQNLSVYIKAALSRGESLDHVLLYGPPGLVKPLSRILLQTKWAFP